VAFSAGGDGGRRSPELPAQRARRLRQSVAEQSRFMSTRPKRFDWHSVGGAAGECCPLVKRNQPRKFTSENISRIKDWVAQGVGRHEIANRLEVSVGSLQVTCSRLGISLRVSSLPGGSGATQPPDPVQRSIEHAAQIKCRLLIQKQNRQAAFDLPLHHDLIGELALEASLRSQTIAHLIGEILMQVMEKDLVDDILRKAKSLPKQPG
jgi:hypothetical protein